MLSDVADRRGEPCETLIARLFGHAPAEREIPADDRSAVLVRM